MAERRLYIDVNPQEGIIVPVKENDLKKEGWVRLGGAMDRFLVKDGLLQDYKFICL